jgi:hypothetical protein
LKALLDDVADIADETTDIYSDLTSSVDDATDTTSASSIQSGLDSFFEGVPLLINALNELSQLHPFIKGKLFLKVILRSRLIALQLLL